MAVNKHPFGGYRAYKKINGREYQFYSRDRTVAEKKQKELDSLSALKSKKVFSKCGRFKGVRINLIIRDGRKPKIVACVQVGPYRKQTKKEYVYKGIFEDMWKWIISQWKYYYSLYPQDVIDYYDQIKKAKIIYISDLSLKEEHLNREIS